MHPNIPHSIYPGPTYLELDYSQQRVIAIRNFNLQLDLPTEDPNRVLYNGALFEAQQLDFNLFLLPKYVTLFTHPLSDYPQDEQHELLTLYGATLARVNHPRAYFIGVPGKIPGLLTVTLHTHKINVQGYWTFVQRTFHLHTPGPIVTYNIIDSSTVLAAPDPDISLCAPEDIVYTIPAHLQSQN